MELERQHRDVSAWVVLRAGTKSAHCVLDLRRY
jgi:hypothetical protein